MNNFLKKYTLKLKVLSPLFIGDGNKLNENEYYVDGDKVKVVDEAKYAEYVYNSKNDKNNEKTYDKLYGKLVKPEDIDEEIWSSIFSYNLINMPNTFEINTNSKKKNKSTEISTFIKDSYGNPYISGSTIKGALRTVILNHFLHNSLKAYDYGKQDIIKFWEEKIDTLEKNTFDKLEFNSSYKNIPSAVKDIMKGICISDSYFMEDEVREQSPTGEESSIFVLCSQKDVDINKSGELEDDRWVGINRECIRPGISFTMYITVDTQIFNKKKLGLEDDSRDIFQCISDWADEFASEYRSIYLQAVTDENHKPKDYGKGVFYIGGGTGYITKTVMYSLLGYDKGLEAVSDIMIAKFPKNHQNDILRGASPYKLKRTDYKATGGELEECEFGVCKLEFKEEPIYG
jgi:CRISPR-associated protein Csm5